MSIDETQQEEGLSRHHRVDADVHPDQIARGCRAAIRPVHLDCLPDTLLTRVVVHRHYLDGGQDT
jgi:hypothetical protein